MCMYQGVKNISFSENLGDEINKRSYIYIFNPIVKIKAGILLMQI